MTDLLIGTRRIRALLALVALAVLGSAFGASSAMAAPKGEFAAFAECPTSNKAVEDCLSARAESGEVKFGTETVPVVSTQTLQGGLYVEEDGEIKFVAAAKGNTLTKTPQKVPGGISGLVYCDEIKGEEKHEKEERKRCEEVYENQLTGVYATIELAAPASSIYVNVDNLIEESGPALKLPIKAKIENPLLGNECYIGSNSKPIEVELTDGTSGSLKGKLGEISTRAEGEILVISNNSLVNGTVSVPGATGCGLFGLLDPIVDARLGIPAKSGNRVVLSGTQELASAEAARESEA